MTLIKFCGMTREEDLAIACELGVEAVGFVLWPNSPRSVDEIGCCARRALPAAVLPVAVFVRPTEDEIGFALEAGAGAADSRHGASSVARIVPTWVAPGCGDGRSSDAAG